MDTEREELFEQCFASIVPGALYSLMILPEVSGTRARVYSSLISRDTI